MNRKTLHPVADRVPGVHAGVQVRAIYTGEKRPPRKGEWYLSGAIPEAYRAPNDLTTPFHIATLVRVHTETVVVVDGPVVSR